MNEREGFLKAIAENPRDFVARKVYADYLDENDQPEEADKQRNWNNEKQDSWEWLEWFASMLSRDPGGEEYPEDDRSRPVSIERVLDAAKVALEGGDDGIHLGFDTPDEVYSCRDEFWKHFEIVTGLHTKGKQPGFVSCGC